ncbi:hypothetical protein AYL99_05253 [Fonsecaea erecta]|uniref:Uncharacterized protein n=1 Tax=Fonsecaea erecta TaxID=1367422 RepID=A0A178ZL90_9EURO|nr:hypothetical protein AYL99_05253 [Fonsecaea erecta]OAP60251.1 hypothetical protein AYL99_05253 [Fonsecaea erecta]
MFRRLYLLYTFALLSAAQSTPSDEYAVQHVANLDNYLVENLAVRGNGKVLVTTSAPAATLWQIDPQSSGNATLITRFPGASGSYGITELQPDLFYVTTGNFSIETRQPVPQSFALFEVDMTGFRQLPTGKITSLPTPQKIASITNATVLNGLTHVDGQAGFVLAADSYAGLVWKVDIATGSVMTAIKDASMDPSPSKAAGINGLKYQNGYLYYTNTGNNLYYRLPIYANGSASAEPETIAQVTKGDDLILDGAGTAYICQQVNSVSRVAINGTQQVIAGTINSNASSLLGPTAVAWGRTPSDRDRLYVTTNGGQSAAFNTSGSQGLSVIGPIAQESTETGNSSASATLSTTQGTATPTQSNGGVVVRRVEKQNAARDAETCQGTPSSEASPDFTSTVTGTTARSSIVKAQGPLQWVIYSAAGEEDLEDGDNSQRLERVSPSVSSDSRCDDTRLTIAESIKPDPQNASINFFFRYYTGTIYDSQLHNSFALLWQPMYLKSSENSPLRLATAAVTVNVAMMWNFRGCDARPARQLFTKALEATRKAIGDPAQSNKDELLMTILVFDLYDALVLHYVPGPLTYGKHKNGAVALLKHRGHVNYLTEVGQGLTSATRHALINHALSLRTRIPAESVQLFTHPSMSGRFGSQLDVLGIQIADTQNRLWSLRRQDGSVQGSGQRRKAFEEIIADVIRIDDLLMAWKRTIPNPDWLPQFVFREDVASSIINAGFYGSKCAVWKDLTYADVFNLYATRRIYTLQMIRQSLADEPSLLADSRYRAILAKANSTIQTLVDAVLETIPAHLGDTVVPTNPIYCSGVAFPFKIIRDAITGELRSIPDLEGSDFRMRASSSGAWMIFPYLLDLYRFAEPEDDAAPIILREGQLEWLKAQIKRLQTTFLYCDPVW